MLKLYIGNKNYSSWSMRPWVLLRQVGIDFEEVKVRFDSFEPDSAFKRTLNDVSPVGKVPVLMDDDLAVWDSLAIAEYLAEQYPGRGVWPAERQARARARSLCAEMHSGFSALRSHCPMNIEARLPEVGARIWREQPAVRTDVERLISMWSALLAPTEVGGRDAGKGFLFGAFSAVDAFFAPVCMRLRSYGLPVPAPVGVYIDRVCAAPGVKAWIDGALAEQDFLAFEEPYRQTP
jgi:glutathione S-transferase